MAKQKTPCIDIEQPPIARFSTGRQKVDGNRGKSEKEQA